MKIAFDKIISRIVALGVPGLVLVVAMASTGLAGGAAIVAALAVLGGPLGLLGGVLALGILVLISQALAERGFQMVFTRVLAGLRAKGHTQVEILAAIDSYPVSAGLKLKLRAAVEQFWDHS